MNKYLKELVELVKDEAKKLRKHATQDQKDSLNYYNLDVTSPSFCVYGQMTGYCYSREALDLIRKCAVRVYNTEGKELTNPIHLKHLNGAPKDFESAGDRTDVYHSPIEMFIVTMEYSDNPDFKHNNQILIDYITGDSDSLEFSFKRKSKYNGQ